MKSVVSVRGQTVIPKDVREKLGIKPGDEINWVIKDRQALIFRVPDDPVEALRGILKDSNYTFDDFMRERNEERRNERIAEEKEEAAWRASSSTPQR